VTVPEIKFVSASSERRVRIRRLLSRRVIPLLVLAVLAYSIYDLVHYSSGSDLFVLQDVTVEGDHLLTEDEIVRCLAIPARIFVWEIDPESLEEKLRAQPLIREAEVRRILPGSLDIHVVERTPFLTWRDSLGGIRYAMDEEGVLLAREDEIERRSEVPLTEGGPGPPPQLVGLAGERFTVGDKIDARSLTELLSVLKLAIERGEVWTSSLQEIHYSQTEGWSLKCRSTALEVRVGWERIVKRLAKLEPVWRFLEKESVYAEYLDLRFDEQGVVVGGADCPPDRWVEIAKQYTVPRSDSRHSTRGTRNSA